MSKSGRWSRAWAAWTRPAADAERDLARLRLDAQAKDEELAQLRAEYARRDGRAEQEKAAAGREAVAGLVRAVAPTLAQLATLRHMAAAGRELRAADVLRLFDRIDQALRDQGLVPIGEPGAEAPFDPAVHQRMSGGDVKDGDRVRVRFPGYRFGGETPLKALVSRIGETETAETKE
jgi:molecular chaperone GrpE (heat shock protein)